MPERRDGDTLHQHQVRQFLKEAREIKLIEKLDTQIGDELVEIFDDLGYVSRGNKTVTKKTFQHFGAPNLDAATIGKEPCRVLIDALPRVGSLHHDPRMCELYERHFDRVYTLVDTGLGYDLFQQSNTRPLGAACPLQGDYLFYRGETQKQIGRDDGEFPMVVSKSFVRFFPHSNNLSQPNKRWRFMFLSLPYSEKYLGARGWVNDIERGLLCVGQIVDRSATDRAGEKTHGGASVFTVSTDAKSKYVLRNEDGIIQAAPVMTMRAANGFEPSLARGYLLRCFGAEEMGGSSKESYNERYLSVRTLQDRLREKTRYAISSAEAAKELSEHSGFPAKCFYEETRHRGRSGLLVNIPYQDDRSRAAGPKAAGITPSKPSKPNPLEFTKSPHEIHLRDSSVKRIGITLTF